MNECMFDQSKDIKAIFSPTTILKLMENYDTYFNSYEKTNIDFCAKDVLARLGFQNTLVGVDEYSVHPECTNCGFKCSRSEICDSQFLQRHAVKCFNGYRYIEPDLLKTFNKYSNHLTLESSFWGYNFSLSISDIDLKKHDFFQFRETPLFAFCCLCGYEFHIGDLLPLKYKEHNIECMMKCIEKTELNKELKNIKSVFDEKCTTNTDEY